MSNARKAKGTRFETDVVNYLNAGDSFPAFKPANRSATDEGDIHFGPFAIQAKAWDRILDGVAAGLRGAARQKIVAGLPFGAMVAKRPRKRISEAYVVLTLEEYRDLMRELHRLFEELEGFYRER